MTDREKAVELLARALAGDNETMWAYRLAHCAECREGAQDYRDDATALLDQIAQLLTAVTVKPLVWEEVNPGVYIAESILGSWSRFDGHYRPPEAYGGIRRDDPASAAQADYEARILASVEAVPVAQAIKAERIACNEELRLAVAAARAEERKKWK